MKAMIATHLDSGAFSYSINPLVSYIVLQGSVGGGGRPFRCTEKKGQRKRRRKKKDRVFLEAAPRKREAPTKMYIPEVVELCLILQAYIHDKSLDLPTPCGHATRDQIDRDVLSALPNPSKKDNNTHTHTTPGHKYMSIFFCM
jgi:hypothetical protein